MNSAAKVCLSWFFSWIKHELLWNNVTSADLFQNSNSRNMRQWVYAFYANCTPWVWSRYIDRSNRNCINRYIHNREMGEGKSRCFFIFIYRSSINLIYWTLSTTVCCFFGFGDDLEDKFYTLLYTNYHTNAVITWRFRRRSCLYMNEFIAKSVYVIWLTWQLEFCEMSSLMRILLGFGVWNHYSTECKVWQINSIFFTTC